MTGLSTANIYSIIFEYYIRFRITFQNPVLIICTCKYCFILFSFLANFSRMAFAKEFTTSKHIFVPFFVISQATFARKLHRTVTISRNFCNFRRVAKIKVQGGLASSNESAFELICFLLFGMSDSCQ